VHNGVRRAEKRPVASGASCIRGWG